MFDSWALQYCVACEKQVQADNDLYCSESCRLADFETTSSTTSSQAGSPGFTPTSSSWNTTPNRSSHTKFFLSPAYDFSNAQPYGSSVAPTSYLDNYSRSSPSKAERTRTSLPTSTLSPSSSHSSLCSMQSTNSTDSTNLSDKARKELHAYAVSFEQVRLQRRRSY